MKSTTLIDINFICYSYTGSSETWTMFLFYPNGMWDEDKLSLPEAIKKYPPTKYNWLHQED